MATDRVANYDYTIEIYVAQIIHAIVIWIKFRSTYLVGAHQLNFRDRMISLSANNNALENY